MVELAADSQDGIAVNAHGTNNHSLFSRGEASNGVIGHSNGDLGGGNVGVFGEHLKSGTGVTGKSQGGFGLLDEGARPERCHQLRSEIARPGLRAIRSNSSQVFGASATAWSSRVTTHRSTSRRHGPNSYTSPACAAMGRFNEFLGECYDPALAPQRTCP
jgi:hypothetical protein